MKINVNSDVGKDLEPVVIASDRISPVVNVKNRPVNAVVRANDLFIVYPTSRNGQVRIINQKDAQNVVLKADNVAAPFRVLEMEKFESVCLIAAATASVELYIWQVSNNSLQAVLPLTVSIPGPVGSVIEAVAFKRGARTVAVTVSGGNSSTTYIYNLEFEPVLNQEIESSEYIQKLQYANASTYPLWLCSKSSVFIQVDGESKALDHKPIQDLKGLVVLPKFDDFVLLGREICYESRNGTTNSIDLTTAVDGATSFAQYGIVWQTGNVFVIAVDVNARNLKSISLLSTDLEILDVTATRNLENKPEVIFDLYVYHSGGIGILSVTRNDLSRNPLSLVLPKSTVAEKLDRRTKSMSPSPEFSPRQNKRIQKSSRPDKNHPIDPEYSRELTDTRRRPDVDMAKLEETMLKSGKFVTRNFFDATRKNLLQRIDLLEKRVTYLLEGSSADSKESSREMPILQRISTPLGTTDTAQAPQKPRDIQTTPVVVSQPKILPSSSESEQATIPVHTSQVVSENPSIPSTPQPSSEEFEAKILELTEAARDQERLCDLLTDFDKSFDPRNGIPLDYSEMHNQLLILSAVACISRGIMSIEVVDTVRNLTEWLRALLKSLQPTLIDVQRKGFVNRVLREVMVNLEITESTEVIPVISIIHDVLSAKVR